MASAVRGRSVFIGKVHDNRRQGDSGDRANRGIGQALVEEALSRGAKRVDAGMRQPRAQTIPDSPLMLVAGDRGRIRDLPGVLARPAEPR